MRGRGAGLFQAAGSRGLFRAGERGVLHGLLGRGEVQGKVSVVRKAKLHCSGCSCGFCGRFSVGGRLSAPQPLLSSLHPAGERPRSSSPGGVAPPAHGGWLVCGGEALPRALDPDLAQEEDSMVTDMLTRA